MSRRNQHRKEHVVRFNDARFCDPNVYVSVPNWALDWKMNTAPDFEPDCFDENNENLDTTDKPLMNNYRVRQYFTHGGDVCSMYRYVFFDQRCWWNEMKEPYDCAILLMSGGHFAGGIFRGGEMTHHKTFHRYVVRAGQGRMQSLHDKSRGQARGAGASIRRHNEKELRSEIQALLDLWEPYMKEMKSVFLRCANHHKGYFFEDRDIERKDAKYKHIPFITARPTLEEVNKVYERLTSVVIHGDEKSFLEEVENNKGKRPKGSHNGNEEDIPSFVSPHRLVRRAEKQSWPNVDAGQKIKIHEAILENDYDLLKESTSYGNKMEMVDYLSTVHDKLERQTFMHFAVKHDLDDTVEFLLDFDCDPSVKDKNGRVPYEYCKNNDMKEVFKQFRANNPDRYTWTKCHIPEPHEITPEQLTIKEVVETKKRNEVKEKRKQKKESKKIIFD